MTEQKTTEHFGKEGAAHYDKGRAKLQPIKDALFVFMDGAFAGLKDDAHVLIVGAGTGEDLLFLAERHAGWRFTVVEPADAMMAVCREKAEAAGITDRCVFHEGYLDTLKDHGPYDAATAVLVSHFITEREERIAFFRAIQDRLTPGGLLYTGDLAIDEAAPQSDKAIEIWIGLLRSSDMPKEMVEKMVRFEDVSLLPPADYAALIADAGFGAPLQLYQGGLMTGWLARKPA